MKRVNKESYEEPQVQVLSVVMENGFAGSPNDPDGDFDHSDSNTEWEEED